MGDPGFVYVLLNTSMPGLVKVGKTAREPSSRAEELSAATGVATPFIVVYQEFFSDCEAAEKYVHSYLESRGYRVAPNREFFKAPTHIVVEAIVKAPRNDTSPTLASPNAERLAEEGKTPWVDLVKRAYDLYAGRVVTVDLDTIEKPINLLEQAAMLGSPEACEIVGSFCWGTDSSPRNSREAERAARARELFREGARRGNFRCWARLAMRYGGARDSANEEECWRRFFDALRANPSLAESQDRVTPSIEEYGHWGLPRVYVLMLRYIESHNTIDHLDVLRTYDKEIVGLCRDQPDVSRRVRKLLGATRPRA